MTRISRLLAAVTLLGSMTAVPASAATLLYTFTPTAITAPRFTFNVDSNPVPVASTPFQFVTTVQNFTVNGVARSGTNSFTFLSTAGGGGFSNAAVIGSYTGSQLYSGTTAAPTLLTGIFTLTGGPATTGGTLNVTTVAAIPEAGTWAMMIVGFGLAGSAMRRRKATTRIACAA